MSYFIFVKFDAQDADNRTGAEHGVQQWNCVRNINRKCSGGFDDANAAAFARVIILRLESLNTLVYYSRLAVSVNDFAENLLYVMKHDAI